MLERFFELFFGTLAPSFRASDNPIAIACFLLVTFLPDRPLFNVPRFRSCIAFSTFLLAFLPYLATGSLPPGTICVSYSCNAGPRFNPAKTDKFLWQSVDAISVSWQCSLSSALKAITRSISTVLTPNTVLRDRNRSCGVLLLGPI